MLVGDGLFDLEPEPVGFRMESWSLVDGAREWVPMDEGPGGKVWAPCSTREAAVHHCILWTGGMSIPAMRVVDVGSGVVVWQDSRLYPDAGEPVLPDWEGPVRAMALAELRAEEVSL